ncbi:alpha/beta fold hydrolase [Salinarimonas soli]|uniref:Alpha/beta hydrolase n=1 Tax=Salinarimonas soli TaxID=1638099 RepID=A0A5B2VEQ7_9HYPH|nr:alpha/beta hydrolase [Salinarimonas soli]KAA2236862.1 alpha/beta hydrolase [Salinarimonas soli]
MVEAETGVGEVRLATNGITLHAVEAGPRDGPLVILLHGFPEFWWGWRRQIEPLAAAGLHVLAPDGRGYDLSDKPRGVGAYDLDTLAADVIGLADALGRRKVALVGHDWGGLVAWWTASKHPHRVDRLVVLNAPHPAVAGSYIRRHPSQLLRSSYVGFFQLPGLPEGLLRARNFALMRRALRRSSRPGTFSPDDLDRYAAAWAQPGALTGMLNWYRALRHRPRLARPTVEPPTLLIWGGRDRFLQKGLAEASLALCRQGRPLWLDGASHWVHIEEAETVNLAMLRFLTGGR